MTTTAAASYAIASPEPPGGTSDRLPSNHGQIRSSDKSASSAAFFRPPRRPPALLRPRRAGSRPKARASAECTERTPAMPGPPPGGAHPPGLRHPLRPPVRRRLIGAARKKQSGYRNPCEKKPFLHFRSPLTNRENLPPESVNTVIYSSAAVGSIRRLPPDSFRSYYN